MGPETHMENLTEEIKTAVADSYTRHEDMQSTWFAGIKKWIKWPGVAAAVGFFGTLIAVVVGFFQLAGTVQAHGATTQQRLDDIATLNHRLDQHATRFESFDKRLGHVETTSATTLTHVDDLVQYQSGQSAYDLHMALHPKK